MQIQIPDSRMRDALAVLVGDVARAGGRALVVGGTVRDGLRGLPAKDLDIEVYGLEPASLRALLEARFALDLVGQSFAVIKLRGLPIDVSLPRRESKRGLGHRGFEIHADPTLPLEEAARRRDFTVNAMAWDPHRGVLLDPFGGAGDLESGCLRHTSPAFSEDPLRVLRGMQMIARFGLRPAPETVALCRTIEPEGLAAERQLDEWRKLLLEGRSISDGLRFLHDCGWLRYIPELSALVGCEQDPEWHPEGDAFVHTLHVLDAFAAHERVGEDWEDLVVGFACLCHDLGKPATTVLRDGRWRSPGHEAEGEPLTRSLLERLAAPVRLVEEVVPLVGHHLKPIQLYLARSGQPAVRRLARKVGRIDRLVRLARADHRGRPPIEFDGFPAGDWLLKRAGELALADTKPHPLVKGRHLIALGLVPGPHFGPLLEAVFEAQLDGVFGDVEGGIAYARTRLAETDRVRSAGG